MKKYINLFIILGINGSLFSYEPDRDPEFINPFLFPLHDAATNSADRFLRFLEQEEGRIPLHEVVESDFERKERISFGRDLEGWTPLHWALQEGVEDVVAFYVINFPDKNFNGLRSKSGVSPLGLAQKKGRENNIKFLWVHEFVRLIRQELRKNEAMMPDDLFDTIVDGAEREVDRLCSRAHPPTSFYEVEKELFGPVFRNFYEIFIADVYAARRSPTDFVDEAGKDKDLKFFVNPFYKGIPSPEVGR